MALTNAEREALLSRAPGGMGGSTYFDLIARNAGYDPMTQTEVGPYHKTTDPYRTLSRAANIMNPLLARHDSVPEAVAAYNWGAPGSPVGAGATGATGDEAVTYPDLQAFLDEEAEDDEPAPPEVTAADLRALRDLINQSADSIGNNAADQWEPGGNPGAQPDYDMATKDGPLNSINAGLMPQDPRSLGEQWKSFTGAWENIYDTVTSLPGTIYDGVLGRGPAAADPRAGLGDLAAANFNGGGGAALAGLGSFQPADLSPVDTSFVTGGSFSRSSTYGGGDSDQGGHGAPADAPGGGGAMGGGADIGSDRGGYGSDRGGLF